jgi:hypothetical protein
MKISIVLLLTFLGAISAVRAEQFEAAKWRDVRTYDIPALQKIQGTQIGKIVGVRIHYRSDRISGRRPSWFESSIWSRTPGEKQKFSFLRVMVAKKDLPSFKAIPTNFQSPAEIVVYGQVQREPDANFLFIRLLGRNATVDLAGKATVDW